MLMFDLTPVKDLYVSKNLCVKWLTIRLTYTVNMLTIYISVSIQT